MYSLVLQCALFENASLLFAFELKYCEILFTVLHPSISEYIRYELYSALC